MRPSPPRCALALLLWIVLCVRVASAQDAATALAAPDPSKHYLFYLHGKIVEDSGRRPVHPRWGVYEYDEIVKALGAQGAIVISELRRRGAAIDAHAARIAAQIRALLAAGVPPAQIAVVGFSKGGLIAQRVAAQLDADVRYVLLAGCFTGVDSTRALHGRLLSIRERSDRQARSCAPLLARSGAGADQPAEIVIDVGGEHGAFYRPQREWLEPLLRFVSE